MIAKQFDKKNNRPNVCIYERRTKEKQYQDSKQTSERIRKKKYTIEIEWAS